MALGRLVGDQSFLQGASVTGSHYQIDLSGPLSVTNELGQDCTPTGEKDRALIALLATNERGRRSRTWVRSMLWADCEPERSSANLRQLVWRLRKQFGEDGSFLDANASTVWLNLRSVRIIENSGSGSSFLEGLDVADETFEDWLLEQRSQRTVQAEERPVGLAIKSDRPEPLAVFVTAIDRSLDTSFFSAYLRSRIESWGFVDTIHCADDPDAMRHHSAEGQTSRLCLRVNISTSLGLSCELKSYAGDAPPWTFFWPLRVEDSSGYEQVLKAIDNLALALLPQFAAHGDSIQSALVTSVHNFFSKDGERQRLARQGFRNASNELPIAKAWLAYSLVVQRAERFGSDAASTDDEVLYLIKQALERDPYNPIINAISGHLYAFTFRCFETADSHARLARDLDPNNKLVLSLSANVANYVGKPQDALELTEAARRRPGLPSLDFLVSASRVTSLTLLERFEEAVAEGESALRQQPGFLGVLRYLPTCHHSLGNHEQRDEAIRQTRSLDPEFTSDGVRQSSYPLPSAQASSMVAQTLRDANASGGNIKEL